MDSSREDAELGGRRGYGQGFLAWSLRVSFELEIDPRLVDRTDLIGSNLFCSDEKSGILLDQLRGHEKSVQRRGVVDRLVGQQVRVDVELAVLQLTDDHFEEMRRNSHLIGSDHLISHVQLLVDGIESER